MGKYEIVLAKKAEKDLDRMSDSIAAPILEGIEKLADDPRPTGCKKLKGRSGYRIGVGDYRLLYEITNEILLVEVTRARHRKNIYQ